jgi:hypothetical protein
LSAKEYLMLRLARAAFLFSSILAICSNLLSSIRARPNMEAMLYKFYESRFKMTLFKYSKKLNIP